MFSYFFPSQTNSDILIERITSFIEARDPQLADEIRTYLCLPGAYYYIYVYAEPYLTRVGHLTLADLDEVMNLIPLIYRERLILSDAEKNNLLDILNS